MSYKAIYCYTWDLAEAGLQTAIDRFRELGLDTVTVAGSYHAGKFLRPHGTGKVYFPEDGTTYFRTNPQRYGAIKPVPNSMIAERDIVRELTQSTEIKTNIWLVLLHNTLLGAAHLEATVANAFGDRYVYSLCPSAPEVRTYAVALARDVSENYPVSGLSIETPGFLPYAHGFHHEFALVRLNRWLENQLGLCFCGHCTTGAKRAGIDANGLKRRIAQNVTAYLASDIDFPADMSEAFWLADTRAEGELRAFLDWRCTVVTSLVQEIRSAVAKEVEIAIIPSVARPTAGSWYEGSDLVELARATGIIEACFYEPGALRVQAEIFDLKRRLEGSGRLRAILRPAYPDFEQENDFRTAVAALIRSGIDELAFYNWGHLRDANISWIGRALQAPRGAS
jgi:hypothetical protein